MMSEIDDEKGTGPRSGGTAFDFRTTRWSVVVLASQDGNAAGEALEQLCETYWLPLYAFARRSGYASHEAQDMTQEFLSHMLEKGALGQADPDKGRFRTYLLSCMKNLLASEYRRSKRLKRGGDCHVFSLDGREPESAYREEPIDGELTPDNVFDRRWAEALVDRVIGRLRDEWEANGKPFGKLKTFLIDPRGTAPMAKVADELNTTESALKTSVHRMRRRYGEIFREEVAHTVADASEVEGEIRYLLTVLG